MQGSPPGEIRLLRLSEEEEVERPSVANVVYLRGMPEGIEEAVDVPLLAQAEDIEERLWRFRSLAVYSLFAIFIGSHVGTFVLFFLVAYGEAVLSDVALASLAAATITETAGLLTIIIKGLFPDAGGD